MEENHAQQMSIFEVPPTDTTITVREWIEYRPINQISQDTAIEFHVTPQSTGYLDLKQSRVNVKIKVTMDDGSPVTQDHVVALVNLPLHSIFSSLECDLQHMPVSQIGTNYPYKAYIDTLLTTQTSRRMDNSSQLFIKDSRGHFDDADAKTGRNIGLHERWIYTRDGGILDLEGPLLLDFFQQERLILNGVPLDLKFWPSKNAFRLMSDSIHPNEKSPYRRRHAQTVHTETQPCTHHGTYQVDRKVSGGVSVHNVVHENSFHCPRGIQFQRRRHVSGRSTFSAYSRIGLQQRLHRRL